MWTHFFDMHSGGRKKTDWESIYIEAPYEEAIAVFQHRFKQHPFEIACDCCGENFSVDSSETLEQATGYHRNCAHVDGKYIEEQKDSWREYQPVADYINNKDVKVIFAADIKPEERVSRKWFCDYDD